MSFFSDQVLNKRGPLGKVWLASHLERKLSKSALLQTNIPNSVTAILGSGDDVVPVMALRLSGQLLLGVARIYSRKAKYLQDDCSEALVKIKLAFRTAPTANGLAGNAGRARGQRGDVDLVEEDAGRANINLNIGGDARGVNDFDVLYNAEFGGFGLWDDFNINPLTAPRSNRKDTSKRNTVANQADITLREDHNLDLDYDRSLDLGFGDDFGIGSQEYRARSAEAEGSEGGIPDGFELGLDLDFELDLGLMDNDELPPAGEAGEEAEGSRQRRDESPAAYAARQKRDKASSASRVASVAAQARQLSEAPSEVLSEVPSVELGRDAATPLSIRHSDIMGPNQEGLDDSVLKGAAEGASFDLDLGGPDFGDAGNDTTFDFGGDQYDRSLPQDGQQTPRATSPAASMEPDGEQRNATPANADNIDNEAGDMTETQIDMTPNTAARVAEAAAVGSAQRKRKEAAEGGAARPKPAKVRKQIVDTVTELAERGRGLGNRDSQSQGVLGGGSLASKEERKAQGLLKDPKYLPASTIEMRFQEIYDHPGKFFFAGMTGFGSTSKSSGLTSFYAGPPGMPAELQALFQFRVGEKGQILGAKRVPNVTVEDLDETNEERRKRARSSVVPEVELGRNRQQSLAPGGDGLFDIGGPADSFDDFGAGGDSANDFSLGLDNMSPGVDVSNATAALEKTPSRLGSAHPTSTPGALDSSLRLDFDGIDRANTSILAVFDDTPLPKEKISTPAGKNGYLSVPGTRQSGISEQQSQLEESVHSASIAASRGRTGGWSRNTVKALKILEHELGPAPEAEEEDDETRQAPKTVSFEALSEKASRKAASSMFFEMLILGTRDCIKLKQEEAYGDISVSSKEKLWQVCDGLNKLTVEADEENEVHTISARPSREATPNAASSDAGDTPTRQNQSRSVRDSTPMVSSSRSIRTAQMSM